MNAKGKHKRGDLIIILVVLLIGVGAAFPWLWNKVNQGNDDNTKPRIAVIKKDGKEMARIDLSKVTEAQDYHYDDGIELTIRAEDGTIKFLDSTCPDQICVKTGRLTKSGDIAVCMPAKTIVTIEGDGY